MLPECGWVELLDTDAVRLKSVWSRKLYPSCQWVQTRVRVGVQVRSKMNEALPAVAFL